MVKRIKGAFEIVAILVLSCLLLIGCLFALNFSTGNNSATINKSNVQISAEHEIIINGTNDDKANKWNEAIEYSISNDGVNVNVVLEDNWTAKDVVEAYHTSFGTGTGFSNGMILIPAGAKITLDLNGKVIDRRMTESTSYGLVIYVKGGELTILDSSCDNEDIIQKYNAVENQPVSTQVNAIKQIGIGKITGGASAGTGGGICVNENGILNFNGGMICDNTYAPVGGGIYAGNSEININGGIIMNNESKTYGGGISIDNCNLVFNGGIILGNLAKNDGGGIYATRSDITINNVIIASNFSYHNGGGLYLTGGDLEIFDVAIKKNASVSHGGGIYVCDTVGTNKIDGTITVHNGVFSENTSNFGAGITLYSGATGVINNAVISKNKVFDTAGGILVYNNSNLTINYATITENEVTYQYNNNSGAAGILLGINSVLTINDGIIENNKCISDGVLGEYLEGGGIKIGGGSSFNVLNIKGGIIRNNVALTNGGGIYDKTGVSEINISGNAQIYGNTANGEESDIHINKGRSININGKLGDTAHIGIRLAGDYGEEVFTNGYSTYNTEKPSAYFFSSNERGKIASINNVEVKLVRTINTDKYEFVYMEEKNGKTYRQKYTDNKLIHGVNDYKCNVAGNYILGNVKPYTSVNEFVGNLNFDITKVKLYNSNGYLIYDKGGVASGLNSSILDNKYNLSVGTGWVLEVIDTTNKVVDTIKISVLGDISGDGRVNSVDITNMRSLVGNTEKYNKLTAEQKLASLVDNKGSISVVDIEILKAYINGDIDLKLYY